MITGKKEEGQRNHTTVSLGTPAMATFKHPRSSTLDDWLELEA